MGKEYNVLGTSLHLYSVQEMMALVDKNMKENGLFVASYLSQEILARASDNEELRQCIEQIDLRIIGEKSILDAVGEEDKVRHRELQENEFMKAFLKRMAREKRSVFCLCDTEKDIEDLTGYLKNHYRDIYVADSYAMENWFGEHDEIINEINGSGADVVLAVLESPFRETFVAQNRNKIGVSLWLSLGERQVEEYTEHHKTSFLWELFRQNMFKRKVNKYKDNK